MGRALKRYHQFCICALTLHLRSNFGLSGLVTSWALELDDCGWSTIKHVTPLSFLGSWELPKIIFSCWSRGFSLAFWLHFNFPALSYLSWFSTSCKSKAAWFVTTFTCGTFPNAGFSSKILFPLRPIDSGMLELSIGAQDPTSPMPISIAAWSLLLVVWVLLGPPFEFQPHLIHSPYCLSASCQLVFSEQCLTSWPILPYIKQIVGSLSYLKVTQCFPPSGLDT